MAASTHSSSSLPILHPGSGFPLPARNYNDINIIRETADRLRDVALALKLRELRIRREDEVSPLETTFPVVDENDEGGDE